MSDIKVEKAIKEIEKILFAAHNANQAAEDTVLSIYDSIYPPEIDESFPHQIFRQRHPRVKREPHLKWIRTLPCLITYNRNKPVEAAHVRYGDLRFAKRQTGMAEKPDDMFVVPLSADYHRLLNESQHQIGEKKFWKRWKIDPVLVAVALFAWSGDDEAGEHIIRQARFGKVK